MRTRIVALLAFASTAIGAGTALGQADLPLYTDRIVNGFQDWGWGTRSFSNTSPTHSGTDSISVTPSSNPGISFHQNDFDSSPYTNLTFWANGGTSGGQVLQVYASLGTTDQAGFNLPALTANTWTQFVVPLSSLNADSKSNLARITIKPTSSSGSVFYLDEIQLQAAPAPVIAHITVDANQTLRTVDGRFFGVNTATWDGNLSQTTTTLNLLREMGCQALRWPGGSTSDGYHWSTNNTLNSRFRTIATNLAGAQVFITVNYGSGSSNEAAAWVRNANITNHCNFKYWEIGNECYGTWENDTNAAAHDPFTYANRVAGYIALMKAADPSIKVGVVGAPGEDNYVNNTSHPATNPRTHQVHNGWTPVMLTRLKSLGVTPDFIVHHVYPEWTDPSQNPVPVADSDPLLLQAASNWANDAADLRQQITDYMGDPGTNMELVCTENNSDSSSAFGIQLTSLVNGLYLADSVCRLMKTEFNAYIWWDLRNGHASTGTFDPTLYGWRTYGDEGMLDGVSGKYPTFYAEKMLQFLARSGDTVLSPSSDYLLLASYAAIKADGSLSLLVINKDSTANLTAQIALDNFTPDTTATVRSYGIPQDDAVRTNNNTPGAQDIATNTVSVDGTFTNTFPPYSLTLFTFTPQAAPPPAPQLLVLSSDPGQLVFQLQGQPSTSYVIESSTDLTFGTWNPVSTNSTLPDGTLNVTNPILPDPVQQYWRAVWQP